jgi:hypothetical protein
LAKEIPKLINHRGIIKNNNYKRPRKINGAFWKGYMPDKEGDLPNPERIEIKISEKEF